MAFLYFLGFSIIRMFARPLCQLGRSQVEQAGSGDRPRPLYDQLIRRKDQGKGPCKWSCGKGLTYKWCQLFLILHAFFMTLHTHIQLENTHTFFFLVAENQVVFQSVSRSQYFLQLRKSLRRRIGIRVDLVSGALHRIHPRIKAAL